MLGHQLRALRLEYPAMFGLTADGDVWGASDGITRQEVKAQVMKYNRGGQQETRGCNNAISEEAESRVIEVLKAVVSTRAVGFTAGLLRPIAIGVLQSLGLIDKLNTDQKRGHFCAGLQWIREITGVRGWRSKASYGNSRKLPPDYEAKGKDMRDRLAAVVMRYNIPMRCVAH